MKLVLKNLYRAALFAGLLTGGTAAVAQDSQSNAPQSDDTKIN